MLSKFNKGQKEVKKEEKQFVVFTVSGEHFGVDIHQTREIINTTELTFVPNAPSFVKGVINLRDEIIPIINLKKRLSLKDNESADEEKIIIVEINNNLIGMQVDDVKEMIRLNVDEIADPPRNY